MSTRTFLLWVAGTLNVTAALAQGAAAPTPTDTSGGIRISIKNLYEATLNFGPLGKGWRRGTDSVVGILKRQGSDYVGIVTAEIDASQELNNPFRSCPKAATKGKQQVKMTGRPVSRFGPFQTITYDRQVSTGRETGEFLELRVYPSTPPRMSAVNPCHGLLEVGGGEFILPLNDSRWSLGPEGYIIVLPSSGLLVYLDDAVAKRKPSGPLPMPLDATVSLWAIKVERLP